MKYLNLLKKYKKENNRKTIESNKLQEIINKDYNEVCQIVKKLEMEGYLKAYGNEHNQRPKNYRLFNKYKIIIEDEKELSSEEIEIYLEEINFKLYSKFEKEKYRSNINLYIKHREKLIMLSEYFKHNRDKLEIQISINERSFEIFKDEKFLKDESSLVKEIFNVIDLNINALNFYYTPEPFFYFTINNQVNNILIVENKDTFYTIRKLFMENKSIFFGIDFSTVIYGEGKKIINSFEDIFYNNNLTYLNKEECVFYYWGDIDREGFWIYETLKEKYESQKIELLIDAYLRMIHESKDTNLRNNKKQQKMKPADFSEFNLKTAEYIQDIVYSDKYIPQEILSYRILREK